jgi:hypothetical protein
MAEKPSQRSDHSGKARDERVELFRTLPKRVTVLKLWQQSGIKQPPTRMDNGRQLTTPASVKWDGLA